MATKPPASTSPSLVRQALYLPLSLTAVYLAFFLALLTPPFQRHFIFLHAISFPFFPTYTTLSLRARTVQNPTSHAQHFGWRADWGLACASRGVLPAPPLGLRSEGWGGEVYERAMREYPTVLYLHGNSMNRAAPFRIAAYSTLTSRLDVNVVAIDYRGFGDSTGTPSEEGLVEDARAAYRWIRAQQQGQRQSVTIFGQSLGTGIGALLASSLETQEDPAQNLVLMAPYTSLKALVKDFRLGGILRSSHQSARYRSTVSS